MCVDVTRKSIDKGGLCLLGHDRLFTTWQRVLLGNGNQVVKGWCSWDVLEVELLSHVDVAGMWR